MYFTLVLLETVSWCGTDWPELTISATLVLDLRHSPPCPHAFCFVRASCCVAQICLKLRIYPTQLLLMLRLWLCGSLRVFTFLLHHLKCGLIHLRGKKGGWGGGEGGSTPLNLIFVDSCICAICGWCFCFVLIFFLRFFFSFC